MRTVENIVIEPNMKVWAYSCRKVGSSYTAIKPCLGIIVNSYFCPIGKDGELKTSGRVSSHLRKYAISEESAIENYNKEIDDIIRYYEDKITHYKNLKL